MGRAVLRCRSQRDDDEDRLGGCSQRHDLLPPGNAQPSPNGVSDLVVQRARIDSALAHGVSQQVYHLSRGRSPHTTLRYRLGNVAGNAPQPHIIQLNDINVAIDEVRDSRFARRLLAHLAVGE